MNTLKTNSNDYLAKIAKNKSLLKEYHTSSCDRTVYLKDGDEFQIQLFNPESTEISVKISIDDSDLSHNIVLRPGERMWLERYTDIKKKFKFDTYLVNGDNKQVSEAIKHNGEIKFSFYRRKKRQPEYIWCEKPYSNIYWWNTVETTPVYYNTSVTCSAANCSTVNDNNVHYTSGLAAQDLAVQLDNSINTVNYSISNSACNVSDDSILCATAATSAASTISMDSFRNDKTIETGRVGEGGNSKQQFTEVNMDFEYFPFKTETIQILPESRKPYTSNDAKKLYCSNCGRKLNTKYKYCPYCGSKID